MGLAPTRKFLHFVRQNKGGVAILFGFLVPTLLGFTGLAVDGAFWLMARNKLQSTSDSAAISVAHSVHLDGGRADSDGEAGKVFTRAYGGEADAIAVTINNPPTSGAFAGNLNAIEVTSSRSQNVKFAGFVGVENVQIRARSVALIDSISDACLLALGPNVDRAVEITGSSQVSLGCGIASNSNSPEAVYFSGSSSTTVSNVSSNGDIYQSSNSTVNVTDGSLRSRAPALEDPYGEAGRDLQVPQHPTNCQARNLRVSNDTTLSPGRYCGGITFQGGTATLSPGVYIIDAGDFNANAQASIVGTDVTIILTGNGNNYAQLDINGGADISLHAPTSGTAYDGVLFFQDPDAPTYQGNNVATNRLNGGSNFSLSGAVYFPSQGISFSGGANTNINCLQLVGYTVSFTGNSEIASVCDENSGTEELSRLDIQLVE